MHPPAVCAPARILAGGYHSFAPRADLPWSMRLVILRIEVGKLPFFVIVLGYLSLGCVLAILRQYAVGSLPQFLGLLPHALFVAILGRQRHHGSQACPTSQGASLQSQSDTAARW
jgi:hypothetical protein